MDNLSYKVTVVMSVYNGLPYLEEAVNSILNQTFTDFEFIIIDDCSTDNTWQILTEYAGRDRRIKIYQNSENMGLTKSLNQGIKLAQGEYIARQDADDVALPQRFEKQVQVLEGQPKTVLAACNVGVINPEGKTVAEHQRACEPELVAWHLIFHNHVAGHSQVMFRRKLVLDLGGYCEARRYSQDYELWCRLVEVGDIVILPEVLQQQRIHNKSVSAEKASDQRHLSLSQSQRNIEKLIGQKLSLEEVAGLRKFWTGSYWWSHFPDSSQASLINSKLKLLYVKFLEQNAVSDSSKPEVSRQLKYLIGQQFIFWIRQVSIFHLFSRLKISFYGFAWHPVGVIGCWLKDLWRLPVSKLLGLVKPTPAKYLDIKVLRQGSSSTD